MRGCEWGRGWCYGWRVGGEDVLGNVAVGDLADGVDIFGLDGGDG